MATPRQQYCSSVPQRVPSKESGNQPTATTGLSTLERWRTRKRLNYTQRRQLQNEAGIVDALGLEVLELEAGHDVHALELLCGVNAVATAGQHWERGEY